MNISTFILDWSGVISDDRRPVYEANMRLLEHYGKERLTFEEWLPRTTPSPREILANHGVTVDPEEIFEKYIKTLNQVRKAGIHPVPYPDVHRVLEALKSEGKKLIVVSTHPEEYLQDEAKEYGIEKYFTLIVGSSKDKAQAILAACKKLQIVPSRKTAVYIGDTIYDIQAAKKAKVYSIGTTNGYHVKERLEKENPDKMIDKLIQLLSL